MQFFRISVGGYIEKILAVVVKELGGLKTVLTVEWDVHYSPVQEWSSREYMKKVEDFKVDIMDFARLTPNDENNTNSSHEDISVTPIHCFGDRKVDLGATEGSWVFIRRRNRSTTGTVNSKSKTDSVTQNSKSKSITGSRFGPLQHTEDPGDEISENNTSIVKSLRNEKEKRWCGI